MSDPATVIGTLSAAVALAQTCAKYISRFKSAHKDAADLLAEVVAVGHVLSGLQAHMVEQEGTTDRSLYMQSSVLFVALNDCQKRLAKIKNDVEPEVLKNKRLLARFWWRLKWPMEQVDAHQAVIALHRYAHLFHFAVNLDGLRAISLSQQESLNQIQSRLDCLQNSEASSDAKVAAEIQDALDAVKFLPEMSAVLTKLTGQVTQLANDSEIDKVLESIPTLPYQDWHRNLQLRRMEGVGQWILEMPDFTKWRDGETQSGVLWCRGAPGVGKTYIMSVIVDHLREFASSDYILYFYFDYKQQSDQTPLKIIQTLLRQLLSRFAQLPTDIPGLEPKEFRRGELPAWKELVAILVNLCKKLKNVFIVFDALDECDQHSNRGPVIEALKELIKKSDVRLLVASRPHPLDVKALLCDYSTITIEASDSDIRAYLLNEIAESPTAFKIIDAGLREEVIKSIMLKAQGMFLVASMQIKNILGQTTRGQVIGALTALPIGLAENIGLTVKRIKSQHPQSVAQAKLAMNVLLWLSHAKRPLKVSELQHAVAIRSEEICVRDMHDPDFFVYCCFGLVVIDEETSIIRLVHFSVNEYLQKHCSEFFPNADDLLTCSCISYMFMHESVLNRRLCFGILPVADDEAPFLTYAARYWGIHASNSVLSKTQKEVQLFCSRREFHAWARLLDIDVVKKNTIDELEAQYVNASSSVLHAAAVYGLNYLMEEYLRKCLPVNTTDYEKATPLMLAAACGRTDILKRLLAQPDIDVHRVDMEQHTALWYAVYRGQAKCVQILLSSGFDLDINRGKPFSLASERLGKSAQYGEIVSLLLSQNDLDSNCEYDSVSAPPWYDLAIGWELDLLCRLVSRPDFDPWRRTPPVKLWPKFTQFIAETDYDYFLVDESWIRKVADLPAIFNLLDADERFCLPEFDMLFLMWPFVYYAFGEDIPYEDADEGRTYSYKIDWMPIWDDTSWTWRSILRRSLEANQLSLHTKDSKNRGFIHYLARQGKEEYLKFILQEGVAIDYKDSLGRTALHYAASEGHKKACDILINAGANPHSVDNDGQNILHLACSSGKLDMVNRLIDLGADVHAKDRYGRTTLHFASKSEEGGAIIELLVRGLRLNVNISTNMGKTPLHTAANRPTVARILLDLGADPNVCGGTGTALSDAIFAGNKTVADMLALDTDLDIPDCLGRTPRSELQFLFKDHRLGGAEQRYTEPANLRVHRDVVLSYLRKRLKGMLDGNDNTDDTFYGAALMLLEVGDEVSAQVMLEHGISPFSNFDTLYWQKLGWCSSCGGDCGYLYMCRTCPYVGNFLMCEDCKEKHKANKDDVSQCVEHSFLQTPSEGWQHLRKGTVNAEGETFDEFLKSLSRKYDKEDSQIIELEDSGETREVADITQ